MSKARELASLGNAYSDGALSNRNLIINGAMQVAQRGTSATGVTANSYKTVDRFEYHAKGTMTGQVTFEQSSDAPSGFKNSAKLTVTTTDTYAVNEYVALPQYIEGYNIAPLGFGTSGAKPFTISFWVKASIVGEYSVAFQNSDNTRNFLHTYNVDVANTWEYKTMTIPADTGGTWPTENTTGLKVWISLGSGSDYAESSTLSTWQTNLVLGSANGVKLLENAGATWQITGVQLEVGDTATPFEHRSYGQELALCQRYFNRYGTQNGFTLLVPSINGGTTNARCGVPLSTKLRATPTVTPSASNAIVIRNHGSFSNYASTSIALGNEQQIEPNLIALSVTVASGLVSASVNIPYINTGHHLDFDAEL